MVRMTIRRRFARTLGAAGIGVGLLLAVPGLAGASTVSSTATTVTVVDQANVPRGTLVDLGPGGNTLEVTEGGQPVTAVAPCVQMGAGTVRCPIAGISGIVVNANGGNDTVQVTLSVPAGIKSTLRGGPGDDVLEGGNTRDLIVGGPGGDQMLGNGNRDTVSYAGIAKKISATIGGGFISGSTLDGPPGSRDQIVPDIEILIGGKKPNKLIGSNQANVLIGGPRSDRLRGEGGNDRVFGQRGNDYLLGNDGNDLLKGGKGHDKFSGGNGIDRLLARDNTADPVIDCGPPAAPELVKFDPGMDFPGNC